MQKGSVSSLSPGIRTTALALAIDAVTAQVVTALRANGIRPLLLKGPSIAGWLYGDGAARPYGDSDLLVASGERSPDTRIPPPRRFEPGTY